MSRSSILELLQANEQILDSQSQAMQSVTQQLTSVKAKLASVQAELAESQAENSRLVESQRSLQLEAGALQHAKAHDAESTEIIAQLRSENVALQKEKRELHEELQRTIKLSADERAEYAAEIERFESKVARQDLEAESLTAQLNRAEAELSALRAAALKPVVPPPPKPLCRDVGCSVEIAPPTPPPSVAPVAAAVDPARWIDRAEHDSEVADLHQEITILNRRLERVATSGNGPALGPNGETAADYELIIAQYKKDLATTARHLEATSQRNKHLVENMSANVATAVSSTHKDNTSLPTSATISGRKALHQTGPSNGSAITRPLTAPSATAPKPAARVSTGRR